MLQAISLSSPDTSETINFAFPEVLIAHIMHFIIMEIVTMNIERYSLGLAVLCFLSLLAGCAPTDVKMLTEHRGMLPAPDRVLVHEFAISPDEVIADRGLERLKGLMDSTPRTEEERVIGRIESEALARNIVAELKAAGIPAEKAGASPYRLENALIIQGQFISIDEGNRAARVVIGLGAGRSDVKTDVQVFETIATGKVLVAELQTDARSGYKPGMAETLGTSAVAGNIAAGAAVGGGVAVIGEGRSADIEADAKRTAEKLVKRLSQYFEYQGWFRQGAVRY